MVDIERPLNGRGERTAPLMGAWMIDTQIQPDLVLCSSAQRAVETWERVKKCGLCYQSAKKISALYHANVDKLYALIQKTPPEVNSLMLIGHNPGLQLLVKDLITEPPAPAIGQKHRVDAFLDKFPTAAFAHIQFPFETWSDIAPKTGSLYCIMSPKLLPT